MKTVMVPPSSALGFSPAAGSGQGPRSKFETEFKKKKKIKNKTLSSSIIQGQANVPKCGQVDP